MLMTVAMRAIIRIIMKSTMKTKTVLTKGTIEMMMPATLQMKIMISQEDQIVDDDDIKCEEQHKYYAGDYRDTFN